MEHPLRFTVEKDGEKHECAAYMGCGLIMINGQWEYHLEDEEWEKIRQLLKESLIEYV